MTSSTTLDISIYGLNKVDNYNALNKTFRNITYKLNNHGYYARGFR